MAKTTLVQANGNGDFSLGFSKNQIAEVHFADVDLVIKTMDGQRFVLPGVAMAAMDRAPPKVLFSDEAMSSEKLAGMVKSFDEVLMNTQIKESETLEAQIKDIQKELDDLKKDAQTLAQEKEEIEQQKADLKEAIEKIEKLKELEKKAEEAEKELAETKEQLDAQDQTQTQMSVAASQEETERNLNQQLEKIRHEIHLKDYDYVPPREFQPPPAPFAGPAGVPAPISMTPLVTLTMGNVVGTETDNTNPGFTLVYGGGGAVGTGAAAKLSPRDVGQFSSALIDGTVDDDKIYAIGPAMGNADPSADTGMYAKEFSLRVAGYFTALNDIVFKGLPSYVSVTGATLQPDGSWILPSAYVIAQQAFKLVYDKDAWRAGGEDRFDMTVVVSGEMRNMTFTSEEKFGFVFMDITDVSQSTNPYLTFWDDGQNKPLYILPTQDQPNTINAGAGNDEVYGSRSHDTIDAGTGDDLVWAYGGNNTVIGGDGNDEIHTGDGNDTVTGGDGNDDISDTGGANTIHAGEGANTVTSGDGNDIITSGSGSDIIDAGAGTNTINAGDGDNQITSGAGNDTITVGNGNNTINAGDGINTITAGDGDNAIVTGAGADTITLRTGTNDVSAGGGNDTVSAEDGDDTLRGEDGDDVLSGGLGTNVLIGGAGNNTASYAAMSVAVTVSLIAGTATAAGMADTLTDIHNVTGSAQNDAITGSVAANILRGGAGNDTIIGSGGNDYMYGEDGDDIVTGGAGNDTIDGGAGADTITGGGGADILRGGDGDDIFLNPASGASFDGGAGFDQINYSGIGSNLTIDLIGGIAYVAGVQSADLASIEWVIGGNGSDTLTGGNADETLDGGAGNDTLTGGGGTNTLIGGTGTNYYNMGVGIDHIQANGTANWDEVRYQGSPAGIVVNLDSVQQSFVNSLGNTITVAALSGTHKAEVASDVSSWAVGDTYANQGVDYVHGTAHRDIIFGSDIREQFYMWDGNDDIYAGGGDDRLYMSAGNDRLDGGAGPDLFYTHVGNNIIAYLDGTVDINGNGTADYIDRGQTAIFQGSGYTGFAYGWSGTTLLRNIESLVGAGGSDYLVGTSGDDQINGGTGQNTVYALGGNDIIFAHRGADTIDAGTGTDTISFSQYDVSLTYVYTGAWHYTTAISAEIYLADADLDSNGAMDKAGTWGSYSGFTYRTLYSGVYSYGIVTNAENIVGTVNADKLAGDANANIIRAWSGNDFICGNGGADSLYGDDGDDTFVVAAADMATVGLIHGGNQTDTVRSSGWTFAAGSINAAKFTYVEAFNVRDAGGGDVYGLNANDIRGVADNGNSSVLRIYLDNGDTFTPTAGAGTGALTALQTTDTASYDVFKFYSDAGHVVDNSVNLVATLHVYYGT